MYVASLGSEFCDTANALTRECENQSKAAKRKMAEYLRHITNVVGFSMSSGGGRFVGKNPGGNGEYFVVVIDSEKYPQVAEHIRICQQMGYPSELTIMRSMQKENRKNSLSRVAPRGDDGFDRDEYPPAMFLEGGTGAHVFYVDAHDNRGAGSTTQHQLSNLPDGTRVRFRVI